MKDGYYISAFVCINELQNIMNIKLRHDQTIALWRCDNGYIELVRYWELERLSGYKHHARALYNMEAFDKLLDYLLGKEGLRRSDVLAIWGTEEVETDTMYRDFFAYTGIAFHNIAHLLTTLFYGNTDPFKDTILLMALDAGPDSQFEKNAYELDYYSGGIVQDGSLQIFKIESPARLWSCAAKKLGLQEGTLMALASATRTKYFSDISRFKHLKFTSQEARSSASYIIDDLYNKIFSITSDEIGKKCSLFDPAFSDIENRMSMLMKMVSDISVSILFQNIDSICMTYGIETRSTTLGMAGGFALNCPINSAILKKYKFKAYQIPPCASDTGIAMGIGLAAFYPFIKSGLCQVDISNAYYGDPIRDLDGAVNRYKDVIKSVDSVGTDEIVSDIIDKTAIVWLSGNAEVGPRALGSRSIIGDPRQMRTKGLLNAIKKREWWRPVAPMILENEGYNYFFDFCRSPNMLLNFNVKQNVVSSIPAVLHFDYTARAQTVSEISNVDIWKLLQEFQKRTGVAVLCNTSLNDIGEPIVNTIEEAIVFALHKGMDAVYCNGNIRINLVIDQNTLGVSAPLRNHLFFHVPDGVDSNAVIKKLNPFGLNVREVTYYFDNPNIFHDYSLQDKEGAEYVRSETNTYLGKYPTGLNR